MSEHQDPLSLLRKRLDELTVVDVEALVRGGVAEGPTLEFKGPLPRKQGSADEPWLRPRRELGHYAKREILAEIVAFTNAEGGTLVLGLDETDEQPPRAARICGVPACQDLADRLRKVIQECVEPSLPRVGVVALETDGDSGVVIIRTEKSFRAPHRLKLDDWRSYIRRDDRTEPMTMQEIQDLTLRIDRGMDRLEQHFRTCRERFATSSWGRPFSRLQLRVSIAPIWPLQVQSVLDRPDAFPHPVDMTVAFSDGRTASLPRVANQRDDQPIVRGARREFKNEDVGAHLQEMKADGTGELWLCRTRGANSVDVYVQTVLAAIATAFRMAHAFRSLAGAPDAEYALEWELAGLIGKPVYLGRLFPSPTPAMPIAVQVFPRLAVGPRALWPRLMTQVVEDLYHAAGERVGYVVTSVEEFV